MNQTNAALLLRWGNPHQRMEAAVAALRKGGGVLLVDDADRENEGDLIFPAESITVSQMAMLIRECSGIVCLCISDDIVQRLGLPMMVKDNASKYGTGFTVPIDAKDGISTGVSAADRVTTVRTAIADNCSRDDLASPGHVFPLRAQAGGVLARRGHTEGTVDLMRLAGLRPAGVLCELTNPDGTMATLPEIVAFSERHNMPVLTIEDLVGYRKSLISKVS